MRYVDGYVLPVPVKNMKAYLRMARIGKKVWLNTAPRLRGQGDDLEVSGGTPFARMLAGSGRPWCFLVSQVAGSPRPREYDGHEGHGSDGAKGNAVDVKRMVCRFSVIGS
jgi:hypothetical protein